MTTSLTLLAAVFDPGSGTAPPGSEGVQTLVSWVAWIVLTLCIVGVLAVGGAMALASNGRGEGGPQMAAKLGWVLAGCIIIGSASALVQAVI